MITQARPSRRRRADGVGEAQWPVWGTQARLVVTDPELLRSARTIVAEHLAAVEKAGSRFRPDSEIVQLGHRHGAPTDVSPLLAELLRAALVAAERTDGDVDPTVGAAMIALGYDRDFALIGSTPVRAVATRTAHWSMLTLHGRTVRLPDGVHLDLGATTKALSADHCARLVAGQLGGGVLISLGGDIATAGTAPLEGWQIRVADGAEEPAGQIALPAGGALATSSTLRRRWSRAGVPLHHILDPRTAQPAAPVWRTVSVAAGSCVEANTISTACIVRGHAARTWLAHLGVPARLVDQHRRVHVLGGWPAESAGAQ